LYFCTSKASKLRLPLARLHQFTCFTTQRLHQFTCFTTRSRASISRRSTASSTPQSTCLTQFTCFTTQFTCFTSLHISTEHSVLDALAPLDLRHQNSKLPRMLQHPLAPAAPAYVSIRQHTSAYVSIRQHTSAYVSIRQHTSAYVSAFTLRSPQAAPTRSCSAFCVSFCTVVLVKRVKLSTGAARRRRSAPLSHAAADCPPSCSAFCVSSLVQKCTYCRRAPSASVVALLSAAVCVRLYQ
jgi:hypothetical protein